MGTDGICLFVVEWMCTGKVVISVGVLVVVVVGIVILVVVEAGVCGIVGVVVGPQGISCHSQQFTLIS